jgi:hypothetical protein
MLVPCLLLVLPSGLPGPPKGGLKDPPRLEVEPPGLVDLGSLGPLERRTRSYVLRNRSARPIRLSILDLPPGLQVEGPALRAPIRPFRAAALTLGVDASGLEGPQRWSAQFQTNDPRQGTYQLPIRFTVRPDLTVDAPRCDFGSVGTHESPERSFTFRRETGEPVALRITSSLPPYLESRVVSGGATARIELILRPGRLEPGVRLGIEHLRVATNAPLQPTFDLYVSWKAHDPVNAEPSRAVFLDAATSSLVVRLASWDGRSFVLEGADVVGGGFEVAWERDREAPVQDLVIRRTAPGTTRSRLVLRFRGQERPLVVPLAYLPGM